MRLAREEEKTDISSISEIKIFDFEKACIDDCKEVYHSFFIDVSIIDLKILKIIFFSPKNFH